MTTVVEQPYDWWIWLLVAAAVALFIVGIIFTILEFPGLLDCPCLYKDLPKENDNGEQIQENRITGNRRIKKMRGKDTPIRRLHRQVSRKISSMDWNEGEDGGAGVGGFVRRLSQKVRREGEGREQGAASGRAGGVRRKSGQRGRLERNDTNVEEIIEDKVNVPEINVDSGDKEEDSTMNGGVGGFVRRMSQKVRRPAEDGSQWMGRKSKVARVRRSAVGPSGDQMEKENEAKLESGVQIEIVDENGLEVDVNYKEMNTESTKKRGMGEFVRKLSRKSRNNTECESPPEEKDEDVEVGGGLETKKRHGSGPREFVRKLSSRSKKPSIGENEIVVNVVNENEEENTNKTLLVPRSGVRKISENWKEQKNIDEEIEEEEEEFKVLETKKKKKKGVKVVVSKSKRRAREFVRKMSMKDRRGSRNNTEELEEDEVKKRRNGRGHLFKQVAVYDKENGYEGDGECTGEEGTRESRNLDGLRLGLGLEEEEGNNGRQGRGPQSRTQLPDIRLEMVDTRTVL